MSSSSKKQATYAENGLALKIIIVIHEVLANQKSRIHEEILSSKARSIFNMQIINVKRERTI